MENTWKVHTNVQKKLTMGKITFGPIRRDNHCNDFMCILPVIFFFGFILFTLVGNFRVLYTLHITGIFYMLNILQKCDMQWLLCIPT